MLKKIIFLLLTGYICCMGQLMPVANSNGFNFAEFNKFKLDLLYDFCKYDTMSIKKYIETDYYVIGAGDTARFQIEKNYNKDRKLLSETKVNTDETFFEKMVYTYNSGGLIISCEKFKKNNKPDGHIYYAYNKNGRLTDYAKYDDDDKVDERCHRVYDSLGFLNSETKYNDEGDSVVARYVNYDAKGNCTKIIIGDDPDDTDRIIKSKYEYY